MNQNENLPAAAGIHQPFETPRFAIINTCDAPQRRMVCEYIKGVGYCYMSRETNTHLKFYDGMTASRPTAMEKFGFMVEYDNHVREVKFTRIATSTATYEDGKPRDWQDRNFPYCFTLPMVRLKKLRPRKSPVQGASEDATPQAEKESRVPKGAVDAPKANG